MIRALPFAKPLGVVRTEKGDILEHALLRRVLDGVPGAVFLIDQNRRIDVANQAARDLFGADIEGLDLVQAVRHPDCLAALNTALKQGKPQVQDLTLTRPVQTSFRLRATPVGKGAVLSFEDITEHVAAEAMRSEFVANVSHELRSPLTAVLGFIETLRSLAPEESDARNRFLAIMEDEASRMNRLIGDLLSLSKVEAQERVRPSTPVILADVLTRVVATLTPLAQKTGADIRLAIDENAGARPVQGDEDQLSQIFVNLVENAIKYGGHGPVDIQVSLLPGAPGIEGAAISVAVTDSGPGIEADHLPRLTERFYRIDAGRSRAQGGTGLGLAIVKHIVSRHRGRLAIDSTQGKGSTFRVTLPVE